MKLKKNITSNWDYENGDFWYDLTKGGYLNPEDFVEESDVLEINKALKVLKQFEQLLEDRLEEQEDE